MLILGIITYGFGLLCCIGIAVPVISFLKLVFRARFQVGLVRLFAYCYAIAAVVFAAYWCWLILGKTCWQLINESGSPGPLGLLAFPVWAAIAVAPSIVGLLLLRSAKS